MKAFPRGLFDGAAVVLGLLIGFVVALSVGRSPRDVPKGVQPVASMTLTAETVDGEHDEGARENIALEEPALEAEINYDAIFARLEAAGFVAVPTEMLKRTRHEPIFPNGLSPDVIKLLQLEQEEVRQLNSVVIATRERYHDLQRENARVVSSSPEEVLVRIETFSGEGLALQEYMKESFSAILGDRDGALLWEMAMRRDSPWYRFGTEPIELTFFNGTTKYPAPIWLKIKPADPEQFFDGTSGGSSAGGFDHLVPLLPRGMRRVFSDPDPNRITQE